MLQFDYIIICYPKKENFPHHSELTKYTNTLGPGVTIQKE